MGEMRASAFLACVFVVSFGGPASAADEAAGSQLPENWYRIQPWAEQPPVNIFRRVAAVQSALGGLQSSVNAYSSALRAQADAHNQRVLMQAELARVEAMQPKPEPRRGNFATRGTPEEIDAAAAARPIEVSGKQPSFSSGDPGYQMTETDAYAIGVSVAEQARASRGWAHSYNNYMLHGTPR
jgi:hypothetical protein